ncbi:MAG: FMN-binding protein [Candidatus Nealsonbacteria bacterium]|nr:FMN-binding protein [Candidatus Nealsonbacteria bacterium]
MPRSILMLTRPLLTLTVVLSVCCAAGAAERTWTDASGSFTINAEMVDYHDGNVHLRRTNGKIAVVPLDKLSAADRAYVKQHAAGTPEPAADGDVTSIRVGAEATIELLSGSKVQGKITAKADKQISCETKVGTRKYQRTYPLDRIHAVVVGDRRIVLNAMVGGSTDTRPRANPADSGSDGRRSRAQVDALIERLGRTPPPWFDSEPLNYPQTLDLSWPQPPPQGWNSQRNVGQYVWDVINPNPDKWRGGVRFMHHLLSVHKDNPQVRLRVMNSLGGMYCNLIQDYARAAFWWRKAGVDRGQQFFHSGLRLAECYWKLGNKQMALELSLKIRPQFGMIKLWGDMGETARALQFAEGNARGEYADFAYMYAGDACRVAGQFRQAVQYYEKLLALPARGQHAKRVQRNQQIGRANLEAVKMFELLDVRRVPDGTYRSSSLGYEAQVHVEVVVKDKRIESVRVTDHHEKQYYACMTDTPRKIIENQGVKGVDATTGATITSKAIINATAKALSGGMTKHE